MQLFFTSDTHFSHERIIQLCNRPFSSIEEMDEKIIENWNDVVKPNDTIYHLGDFSFNKEKKDSHFLHRLNGKKHLIKGNHDKQPSIKDGWSSINDYLKIKFNKKRIILCHYPLREWDGFFSGAWHLYGHVHGKLSPLENTKSADVGVDVCNYYPISFEELFEKFELNN